MRRLAFFVLVVLLALPSLALAQDDIAQQVAQEFISALNARDFQRMADCFSPDAEGHFLTPVGFTEATGGAEVAEQFRTWFGGGSSFEIAEAKVKPVGTKLHLSYDFRAVYEDQAFRGEQHAYVMIEDGLIASLDLLCSGFFPVE